MLFVIGSVLISGERADATGRVPGAGYFEGCCAMPRPGCLAKLVYLLPRIGPPHGWDVLLRLSHGIGTPPSVRDLLGSEQLLGSYGTIHNRSLNPNPHIDTDCLMFTLFRAQSNGGGVPNLGLVGAHLSRCNHLHMKSKSYTYEIAII